ncbi:uncharacterized protein LOC124806326 [Hydra vulgaris]|uniref:uncharacterized protein LOC124806326 n=1 Tax=Hydra vulgaris TaxID=6087 RepID=UPI0032EA434B
MSLESDEVTFHQDINYSNDVYYQLKCQMLKESTEERKKPESELTLIHQISKESLPISNNNYLEDIMNTKQENCFTSTILSPEKNTNLDEAIQTLKWKYYNNRMKQRKTEKTSKTLLPGEYNANDTGTKPREHINIGCEQNCEDGPTSIPTKCENDDEGETTTSIESGKNIIEISSDEEWVEEVEEEEPNACCDNITRTNRCAELKLDNSELLCFNKELKRGFDIFHVINTGKPTSSIWYNQKEAKCDALDICTKTHTICRYFDGKESEFSGQLHTHTILASYVLDKSERSPEGEALRIRRAYFRERQYLCRGCGEITRKRYGHFCHMCNCRISVKHVTSASYFKNAVVYVLDRD